MKLRSFPLLILVCSLLSCMMLAGGSGKPVRASPAEVLVFNGTGTSTPDENLLVQLLASHGLSYQEVNSTQLAAMSLTVLASYKLILWPGGDSITMTGHLPAAARENIREAVVNRGVSYVGFCAGAFMAVGPTTPAHAGWGLGIVPGSYLKVYTPAGISNPSPSVAVMVNLSFPHGSHNWMYWQYGPALLPWSHGIIATYAGGQSAMGEVWSGSGFVVLSAVHPEATQGWLAAKNLVDPDGLDATVAWSLIQAASTRTPLPTF